MNLQDIIIKIKEKKELSGIPDKLVSKEVENYLKKEGILSGDFKVKDKKIIVSAVRANLRRITGQFSIDSKGDLKSEHKSSNERLKIYPVLKRLISELNVKSILDLGCGLNPVHLASEGVFYYAYDINENDLRAVSRYFKENSISGKTKLFDLRDSDEKFPESDICFILKVFDIIESRGHKIAEDIINRISSKYILISFPTKTLSGKPMNHPQRGWIERLLSRLGFAYIFFKGENEIFYLASRQENRKLLLSLQSIQEML